MTLVCQVHICSQTIWYLVTWVGGYLRLAHLDNLCQLNGDLLGRVVSLGGLFAPVE